MIIDMDWLAFSSGAVDVFLLVALIVWTAAALTAWQIDEPRVGASALMTGRAGGIFGLLMMAGLAAVVIQRFEWIPPYLAAAVAASCGLFALIEAGWNWRLLKRSARLVAAAPVLLIAITASLMQATSSQGGRWVLLIAGLAVVMIFVSVYTAARLQLHFVRGLPIATDCKSVLRRKSFFFALGLLVLVAVGVGVTHWRLSRHFAEQSERLIWRVKTAALSLDLDSVLRLSGKRSDRRMPAYTNVRSQLKKILVANSDIASALLWRRQHERVMILARATTDSDDADPGSDEAGGAANLNLDGARFEAPQPYVQILRYVGRSVRIVAQERIHDPTDQSRQTVYAWLNLEFRSEAWTRERSEIQFQILVGTYLAALVIMAVFGWITRIEIERDSEKEKLSLVEAERERFARDLHDGLGQTLTGLAFRARALSRELDGAPATEVGEIAGMLSAAVAEARAIAHAQLPPALKAGGLAGGLKWLADTTRRLFGISVEVELPDELPPFDDDSAHALIQVVREAFHNAVRHGQAKQIQFQLKREKNEWTMDVQDDGLGIPGDLDAGNGLGLRLMRARIRELGGRIEFRPNPNGGWWVHARFPARRAEEIAS